MKNWFMCILKQYKKNRISAIIISLYNKYDWLFNVIIKYTDENFAILETSKSKSPSLSNSKKETRRRIFYPKRSLIWNFFEEVEANLVKCKLCGVTMSLNMSRHLKRSHPKDYSKLQILKAKCRQKGLTNHF